MNQLKDFLRDGLHGIRMVEVPNAKLFKLSRFADGALLCSGLRGDKAGFDVCHMPRYGLEKRRLQFIAKVPMDEERALLFTCEIEIGRYAVNDRRAGQRECDGIHQCLLRLKS